MSENIIIIQTDLDEALKKLRRQLGPLQEQAPAVLAKAVNDVARQVRKQIVKDARGEYVLQDATALHANKAMKLQGARKSKPEATIKAQGEMQDLMKFLVSPTALSRGAGRPGAYAAQVRKGGGIKALGGSPKPFVTQFRSGHIAIVTRVPGKTMKSNPKRTFIKKLLSPAVPHMLRNPEVQEEAERLVAQRLPTAVQKQVEKLLAREAR